jgi:cell division protease FtsH
MVKTAMGRWGTFPRVFLVLVAFIACIALIAYFQPKHVLTGNQVALSDFLTDVNAGKIRAVVLRGRTILAERIDGSTFATYSPADANFIIQKLMEKGVRILANPEEDDANPMIRLLLSWLPWLLWVLAFRVIGVRVVMRPDRGAVRRITDLEARLRSLEVAAH